MNKILELLEKKFLNWEEIEEIQESKFVKETIFNGYSGKYSSAYWFTVILEDGEEYDIYEK